MNIFEVSKFFQSEKKIRRASWDPREYIHNPCDMLEYVYVNRSSVTMKKDGDKWEMIYSNHLSKEYWMPGLEDLLAEDWELYNEN